MTPADLDDIERRDREMMAAAGGSDLAEKREAFLLTVIAHIPALIAAARELARLQAAPSDRREGTCPTCGSDDPAWQRETRLGPCEHPFHGDAR